MQNALIRLEAILTTEVPKLLAIPEAASLRKPNESGWCAKEVLGHLIDSASNNHQRFIRGQLTGELISPGYEQNQWVARGAYISRPWTELVELWAAMNKQMLQIARHMNPDSLSTAIVIAGNPPVTLEFVVTDYVAHMDHHLRQLREAVS